MTRWVLLAVMSSMGVGLGACGGDERTGNLPDAASSPDGAIADASPSTSVTVTVTLAGVAVPNQVVYFQSRDSSMTVTRMTDANGNATADVEAGGYVTVIEPKRPDVPEDFTGLSTIADVQPGDHLYFDIPIFDPNAGVKTSVTVSVPDEGLGHTYHLFSTCGFGEIGKGNNQLGRTGVKLALAAISNTITLTNCDGAADMLVVGLDQERIVRTWSYKAGVTVSDGTVVEFASYEQPVDVTFSYTFASRQALQVLRRLNSPRGFLYNESAFVVIDGTGSTTIAMPSPPGVTASTSSFERFQDGRAANEVTDWGGANDNYSLDFQAVAPHRFANASFDIATRTVMWTETSTGESPDIVVASYDNGRSDESGRRDWAWRIVGAHRAGQSTLSFPSLPATPYDFNPRVSDDLNFGGVTLVRNPGGYAAVRPRLFAGDDTYSKESLVMGDSGRIVVFGVD